MPIGGATPPPVNPAAAFFNAVGKFITKFLSKKVAGFTVRSILTAATVAVGVRNIQQMRDLMNKGQNILATKVAQGGKIPVLYGRRRIGSTVIYLDTADNRSKDLFVVYALSVGEIEQIEGMTIELDGNPITDTKRFRKGFYIGSDKISSGAGSLNTGNQIGAVNTETNNGRSGTSTTGKYMMVFNCHHGAATQTADPMLTASISSKWTSAHKLNGIAYIAAHFEFDKKGMFKGIPQLTVVVKGKKVYDPRKDGSISGGTGSHRLGTVSTYEWSDNPALTFLDYITNTEYGKGLTASDLNMSTFQTAANNADTLQDTPDYSGSAAASTFSGTSGDNFVDIDATTYNKVKIGAELTLVNSGSTTEFDAVEVISSQRFQPFDSSAINRITVNDTLSQNYSSETGTALVKVKRFTCNGMLDPSESVLENARELLSNMRGIFTYSQGKYELKLEDTESSTFTVTEDHIIADAGIQVSYERKDKKANKVTVEYFNGLKNYELDTVTVFHDASPNYTSDDGGEELEIKVNFPYVVNPYVAYNMGYAILKRSRNQKTVSFLATPELYKVNVGDVITVDYSPVGSPSGLYRVEALDLLPNGLVSVNAIQYLDIYTWQDPSAENVEALVNLPQSFAVKPPTGLSFTDTNSSSTGRPFISWTEPTDFPVNQYIVNIVDSSSNKLLNKIVDVPFIDLAFLPTGSNFVASVTSVSSVGTESEAATLTFSVTNKPVVAGDVDVPGVISAGSIIVSGDNVTTLSNNANYVASGDNVSALTNNAGYVNSSQAASAAPVQSVAGATGAVSAATIISAGSIVVQGDNISSLTNNSNFINGSQVNSNVTAISGGVITTGTINSARLNTDTLNVKQFDNVTSKIINHQSNKVPLTRFESTFSSTGNTGSSGTHTCADVTVTQCRTGGSFVAFATGVLGDIQNFRVQFSVDGGSTYSNCANGITHNLSAGVYRPYTYIYQDQLTFTGSNETAKFRIIMVGKQNYTSIGLTVLVDNTN